MRASRPVDVRNYDLTSYDALYASFRWEIPSRFNLGEALCDQNSSLEGTALTYDDDDHSVSYSFRDLKNLSNKFANYLQDLNVKRGDRIAILLPQRPETAISLLAVYKTGGIAVTLSTLFGWDAIKYRVNDSRARLLIVDDSVKQKVETWKNETELDSLVAVDCDAGEREREFSESSGCSRNFTVTETSKNDPAHIYYTSGTTGPPKGALHAHRFMFGHIPCWQLACDIGPKEGDVYWTPSDWAWIGGSGNVLFPALYFGMPVIAYNRKGRFDPNDALSIVERYKVTCSYMPATALRMIMKNVPKPRQEYSLEKFRSIITGGEPLGTIITWAQENLAIHVNETYGQTEANLLVTSCAVLGAQKLFAAGKPCPGHIVEVLSEDGTVLPPNARGEIAVKVNGDPVIFLEYWSQPHATKMKFTNGWLRTGDLGFKDELGYVHFQSRSDDLIKSSAYRIGPSEVEEAINSLPAVLESAVIGKHDVERGQIVKAFVVLRERNKNLDQIRDEIIKRVKRKVAEYAYPREIEFIDEIPKTTSGKIKRFELRAREETSNG
jgi:acetyl-CoA synthetase